MEDERYIEIENYENEFWRLIESSFKIKLEGMSTSASSVINGPINCKARFPTKNRKLLGTDYLNSSSKKVIHFTSLQVLFSIINEGAFRLYNLHNSNDAFEYSYAAEKLKSIYKLQGQDENDLNNFINTIKEYSFILSCTSHDNLKKENFWQKYGDKNKGVAIELEIINPLEEWEYFYFSKVHYEKLEVFHELKQQWENIQAKNSHFLYQISLNQILSLHKSVDWSDEEEIRFLTLYPDLHTIPFEKQIFRDYKPSKPNGRIKYFKLPLCDKTGNFIDKNLNNRIEIFWSIIPRIRISDVHFAPDFPMKNEEFRHFQEKLKYYAAQKMNIWLANLPKNKVLTE